MFNAEEREYLRKNHALEHDSHGNEHLIGLTVEETKFYIQISKAPVSGDFPSKAIIDRFLELSQRHERRRLAVAHAAGVG